MQLKKQSLSQQNNALKNIIKSFNMQTNRLTLRKGARVISLKLRVLSIFRLKFSIKIENESLLEQTISTKSRMHKFTQFSNNPSIMTLDGHK